MNDWISTFPGYGKLLTQLKKVFGQIIKTGPTPKHVGLIMDGNRRYAKNHKIELKEGHNLGFESMASILELLYESGVESATVYAFSIENFKRSSYEVKWLMDLAKSKFRQISQHGELCEQYGIKIKILGNTRLLPTDVQKILFETEEITKNNTRAVLNVCFPYTARDEITHSVKSSVEDYLKNKDYIIDETTIDNHLYTSNSPPLDLLVRTSGTYRLSDFLLWQAVSPECAIVFSDKLWPEFTPWDMAKILINWSFNHYWYGHGNGMVTTKILNSPKHHAEITSVDGATGTTGFARYSDAEYEEDDDDDLDDDDNDDSDNSELAPGDLETSPSTEEDTGKP
ncbi:hypothetical protein QCA50_016797 [Cerrena zonata]|uniref:Alkyl transferase n=1 Tax=Cerrena zonata TaxID=2478898 RepID=A0AAW0FL78_9APHY